MRSCNVRLQEISVRCHSSFRIFGSSGRHSHNELITCGMAGRSNDSVLPPQSPVFRLDALSVLPSFKEEPIAEFRAWIGWPQAVLTEDPACSSCSFTCHWLPHNLDTRSKHLAAAKPVAATISPTQLSSALGPVHNARLQDAVQPSRHGSAKYCNLAMVGRDIKCGYIHCRPPRLWRNYPLLPAARLREANGSVRLDA